MVYSNDESDKAIRQRNFYLYVYVLPGVLFLLMMALVYVAAYVYHTGRGEIIFLLISSLSYVTQGHNYQKEKWAKMPDGTYYHIKSILQNQPFYLDEPASYEAEFFQPRWQKIFVLLFGVGLAIVGVGGFVFYKVSPFVAFFLALQGIFFTLWGAKKLSDNSASLKLDKKGLWMKRLEFVPWTAVVDVRITEDDTGDNKHAYLEVYLHNTIFARIGKPDARLEITYLSEKSKIKPLIEEYRSLAIQTPVHE
ncbi:hypothetical protein SAMN05421788_107306 [Filimonas lacunae]|uniref:Uncharacterized protein n=1 Tax=Filimonas lacunae TaxID=477680 RepID=A0A173MGM1_9BACT|nr:hypothetical protein [Filimonas lacunae]BAV06646.1 hypothetical protein FLA_2665 [Filimonas lacunae]SIT27740.1 hypothetical protein SAMN05421788_107306 [Filimonas lacunae]